MNLIDNLFSDLSFKSVSLDNMSEELCNVCMANIE